MAKHHFQARPATSDKPRQVAPSADFASALQAFQRGELDQAQAICTSMLVRHTNTFDPLHLLGVIAYQAGDHGSAAPFLQRAIAVNPQSAEAFNNLGLVWHAQQQFDKAMESFDRAISLNPRFAEAYSNRSLTLFALKRYQLAVDDCDTALSIRAEYAEALNNRAHALICLHRHQEAIADLEHALRIFPNYETAHYNLGVAHHELQHTSEALFHYEQTLKLNPNHALTYWNVALLSLLIGDYAVGWELHEWRFRQKNYRQNPYNFGGPLWLGEQPLQGKTILLYCEQGLGDTIQFCRYAPLLAQIGARVILYVQPSLVRTLRCLPASVTPIAIGDALPEYDFHCPLLSLPQAFRTTLESIPLTGSYLQADAEKSARWLQRLAPFGKQKRVGLVWSGGFRANQPEIWNINERRNIPLDLIAGLNCPGLLFISLQKGNPAEAELLERKQEVWPSANLLNFADELKDFSDTAALIDNLDLVISVDTSTAHLAAAMGKPVWLLNRYDTCWRWLLKGQDSPWYDSVRVYRQMEFGDWDGVIRRVRHDLSSLIESPV